MRDKKIINWEKSIQPLHLPKILKPITEYLSTNGAHKNFKEYVKTNQAKKPISVNEIPTSLSHALNVEKTSIYGRPEANPSSKIPNIFLFITLIVINPNQKMVQDLFFFLELSHYDQQYFSC